MADANIRAVITAKDEASKTISSFGKNAEGSFLKLGAVVGAVSGIMQTVTTRAISALSESLGTAINRVDTLNNATRTFQNMGFSVDDTSKAMKALNASILGLPTSLDKAVQNMELLASSTNDIGKSQKIFAALNDGILGFGGNADQVNTAVIQLSQAFAGGRVMAQDWNSMLNAGLGPALNAISREMGITQRDLKAGLSDGSISVEKFQDALITLDEKGGGGLKSLHQIAKDSTAGISTGIANMKTAIARGMANIIEAIGPSKISGAISAFGKIMEDGSKYVIRLMENFKSVWPAIQGVAAQVEQYLRPKLEALWDTIQNKLIPIFKELWHNVIEPLLPIIGGALVGAIGFVIDGFTGLINFIDYMEPGFKSFIGTLKELWNWLYGMLAPSIKALGDTIMTQLWPQLKKLWDAVEPGFTGALKVLGVIIGAVVVAAIWIFINAINLSAKALGWLAGITGEVVTGIGNIIGVVKNFVVEMGRALGGVADQFIAPFRTAFGVIERLYNETIGRIAGKIGQQAAQVGGGGGGGSSFIAPLKPIGKNAEGTDYWSGGQTLVGEKGPEIVNLPRGSQVIPNDKIGSGSNQPINVTFNGVFTGNEMEFRKLAIKVFQAASDVADMKNNEITGMTTQDWRRA